MNKALALALALILFTASRLLSQNSFPYQIDLEPITITGLPGLHSYAFGQHDEKWLLIGGRKDGLHARQPFNAFPGSENNTDLYVIDVNTHQFWSTSLNTLPVPIAEQLQSTNMNFHQYGDTLVIVGGYSYSSSAGDHKTFPELTTVLVSATIDAVINNASIVPYFKQIGDTTFAVTGGQLGRIDDVFYLVGGQKFDGRYNPMGHPSYTQSYTHQVRKFTLNNSGTQLSFTGAGVFNDPVHLRRRDYNLLPQVFPDGSTGFTISSGVFQLGADLPYLYPVDVKDTGYFPITSFNQYLSNYHGAHIGLHDSTMNEMHELFFGGMSQYYYQGNTLIQDDLVPFVKTISRLTRDANGTLQEFRMPIEMPSLQGASSEFIPNEELPMYANGVIKLSEVTTDTIIIGHIYGGIQSPSLNPFSMNQTGATSADNGIFRVSLIYDPAAQATTVDGGNPYSMVVFPNPASGRISVEFDFDPPFNTMYYLTDIHGRLLQQGRIEISKKKWHLDLNPGDSEVLLLTVVIEDKFYMTERIIVH